MRSLGIKIIPKYEFGQDVWYKVLYPATEECSDCHGEGVLHGTSYDLPCTPCGGTGIRLSKVKREYSVLKGRVYSYRATIYKEGVHLKYRLDIPRGDIVNKTEEDLFGSEEEALAWCEEENRKMRGEKDGD